MILILIGLGGVVYGIIITYNDVDKIGQLTNLLLSTSLHNPLSVKDPHHEVSRFTHHTTYQKTLI